MEKVGTRFYICRHCGNLVGMIHNSGAPITCCGEEMSELIPNSSGASTEKHLPKLSIVGNTLRVTVGVVIHPMSEEHRIDWIYLQTENGGQRRITTVGGAPEAVFNTLGEKVVAAYAYCNLHGLWKTEIEPKN